MRIWASRASIGWVALALAIGCSAADGGGEGGAGGSTAGGAGSGATAGGGAGGTASGGGGGAGASGAAGGGGAGGAAGAAGGAGGSGPGGPAGVAGAAGSGGAGGAGGAAASGGTGGTGGSAGAGAAFGATAALPSLGSLVILGDSIGDGGGQAPYYYDLLRADLQARYGTLQYQRKANSGSKTDDLDDQVQDLPSTLAGPVAVCISSGGNDMKAALAQIVLGTDAVAKATMGNQITQALDLLLAPGRFGPGVSVYVFELNIYDASDGQGNFSQGGCAFGGGLPAIPTDACFASWNAEIASRVNGRGMLTDLWGHFRDHGYNHPPKWYANDCTHPNSVGHDQLRRLFYWKITGQLLP
ncbi:MAG: SGNH/GDSL hydrolase family protein [Polyangiaceae bacterium]|nr:SGNH/GDSL hydrolase family protein [Polyangiaceae bacterium]